MTDDRDDDEKRHGKAAEEYQPEEVPEEFAPAVERLTKDLRAAAAHLSEAEARYLVDLYYQVQRFRVASAGQVRSGVQAAEGEAPNEPNVFLQYVTDAMHLLEGNIAKAMDIYTDTQPVSRWAKSQYGIGPVLAAGISAHVDVRRAATAGAIWRFAGLDPSLRWLGREKVKEVIARVLGAAKKVTSEHIIALASELNRRPEAIELLARRYGDGKVTVTSLGKAAAQRPYNARFKVLAWKLGQSFWKFHNRLDCLYGKLIAERWAQETAANEQGRFAAAAATSLETRRIQDKELRATYEAGHLPKGRILLRAQRWGVKLFLAHWWQVARDAKALPIPKPYVLTQPNHTHYISPPGWVTHSNTDSSVISGAGHLPNEPCPRGICVKSPSQ